MNREVGTARGPAPGAAAAEEAAEPLPHSRALAATSLLIPSHSRCQLFSEAHRLTAAPSAGSPPSDVILPGHTWGRDDLTVPLPSDLPLLQSFLTHTCPRRHTTQQTPCTRRGRQTWLTNPSLPLPCTPMESTQELGSWHCHVPPQNTPAPLPSPQINRSSHHEAARATWESHLRACALHTQMPFSTQLCPCSLLRDIILQ